MKQFTFPKAEHLCLRREIEELFSAGSRSMSVWPLRAVFRAVPHEKGAAVKVLLSVPKKRLRHAVDRNRAKRQLREAYRHEKHALLSALLPNEGLHIGFLWLSDRPVETDMVRKRVKTLLCQIEEKIVALRKQSSAEGES